MASKRIDLYRRINVWSLRDLMHHATVNQTKLGMSWMPSRPLGKFGLLHRMKCALAVFNGKADIVYWPGDQ